MITNSKEMGKNISISNGSYKKSRKKFQKENKSIMINVTAIILK